MDLGGEWRAVVADEDLRRTWLDELDDDGWSPVAVPGHWRAEPAFGGADGPLLYRTRFEHEGPAEPGERWWLRFDGVLYQGDVWLDGQYVGDTEGYFFPHSFDVTDQLETGGEHALAIDVTCSPQHDRAAKRNITGVFQQWDCIDPDWNPGGLWRPVRLENTGPVQIRHARVLCQDASTEAATVFVRTVIDTRETRTAQLVTTVADALTRLTPEVAHVVLDLMLPDGAGEAVLRKIRDRALPASVWITTGINDTVRLERVQELHPQAILRKPIDVDRLLRGLAEVH